MKTLIIAEAGVNHNGDLKIAKKMVEIAAHAGADLVKFQTFSADRLVTQDAAKADYQIIATNSKESQQDMLRKLELTESMHRELIAHCLTQNIGFFSTGFDVESINFLVELGQELFKIPSGEITNLPYLRHIGRLGKTVILSTGMSNMIEIEEAIDVLEESGTPRANITVLHCTTAYPVPLKDVNLLAMESIRNRFNVAVGYSDHTLGIEISIAAVALGAAVIEKHFTIDRNLIGPDHKASLEPLELKAMVEGIRNVEKALGDGIKRLMPSETSNVTNIRKSIVANSVIKEGDFFSTENLTTKRSGNGISPMQMDNLVGRVATRNYKKDELIQQ